VLRSAALLVLVVLLAGCAQPESVPTPTSTSSSVSTPTTSTPASPPASGGPATLLSGFGVALAPFDPATGRAGAVVFGEAAPLVEFGEDGSPSITLRVAEGTPVAAPLDAQVADTGHLPDGTPTVNLSAGSKLVVLQHVAPRTTPGAQVRAGDIIGTVQGGAFSLALLDTPTKAVCPASQMPQGASDALDRLKSDWRAFKGDPSLYPPREHAIPGCWFGETAWRVEQGPGPGTDDPWAQQQKLIAALPPCGDAPFTASPVSELHGIIPLGNVNPPEHTIPSDHVYFLYPRLPPGSATTFGAVDVYAPGDVLIYAVQEQLAQRDGATNDDYAISYAPCREVSAWFGHVSSLAGGLKDAFDAATKASPSACQDYGDAERHASFHVCDARFAYHAKAGEKIGMGGGKASAALDMGANDARVDNAPSFVSPARFPSEKNIVCPVGLFASPLRATLEAQLGQEGAPRTVEPRCGTIAQDVAGTLAGAWFRPEVSPTDGLGPEAWNRSLEMGVEAMDGKTALLALGGPGGALRLAFAPTHAGAYNRAFAEVKPGEGVVCYQSETPALDTSLLLSLLDATHLKLERRAGACGSGPWSLTDAALEYVR